jgi:Lon protease-like protein
MSQLPSILPVFPLTGSLLLPGTWLPLNIFEPRYRNLVADALEGDRHIGMIQPVVPGRDNRPDPDADPDHPELYAVGCAGVIDQAERQPDGRYLILLKGLCRFRIRRELPLHRGYRRVEAGYAEFDTDLHEPLSEIDPAPLLASLKAFAARHDLSFDLQRLRLMPGVSLLNGLAVALPFAPGEKQALLEAEDLAERREMLLSLMGMGLSPLPEDHGYAPPMVN